MTFLRLVYKAFLAQATLQRACSEFPTLPLGAYDECGAVLQELNASIDATDRRVYHSQLLVFMREYRYKWGEFCDFVQLLHTYNCVLVMDSSLVFKEVFTQLRSQIDSLEKECTFKKLSELQKTVALLQLMHEVTVDK